MRGMEVVDTRARKPVILVSLLLSTESREEATLDQFRFEEIEKERREQKEKRTKDDLLNS